MVVARDGGTEIGPDIKTFAGGDAIRTVRFVVTLATSLPSTEITTVAGPPGLASVELQTLHMPPVIHQTGLAEGANADCNTRT